METRDAPPPLRPPVALGCTAAVGVLTLIAFIIVLGAIFLDSGADSGKVTLDVEDAYEPGSWTRVTARGFYLVRLLSGDFVALDDLDAANRLRTGQRCRVDTIAARDVTLAALLEKYAGRVTADAAGSPTLFREACNGAIYDLAGARVDGDGRNLDRLAITRDQAGRIVVNTARRTCTTRAGIETTIPSDCD